MTLKYPPVLLSRRTLVKGALLASAAPLLAACQSDIFPKHLQPIPASLQLKMENLDMSESDPVYMRIFKEEAELEVWKRGPQGKYLLLETYEICTWSGELGPKFQEGDRQAPEGFYTVTPAQMNPNSNFYLSFNLGFPNAYDRSHGRTGTHLMVHGACSSAGCYAMTDEQIAEIYALAREAFEGGQRAFQVHAFPFRMTPDNMARHAAHQHFAFWQMLQEGYQHFELTQIPPQVDVCDRRYIFNAVAAEQFSAAEECPAFTMPDSIANAFQAAQAEHQAAFEVALNQYFPDGISLPAVAEPGQVLVATQPAPAATQPASLATAAPSPTVPPAPVAAPVVEVATPAPAPAPAPIAEPVAAAAPATQTPIPPPPAIEVAAPPAAEPLLPPVAEADAAVETAAATEASSEGSFASRAGSLFDGLFQGN